MTQSGLRDRTRLALFVRHAECTKNISEMVGGAGLSEALTPDGEANADVLASSLRALADVHGPFELLVADSERARLTASRIVRQCTPTLSSQLPLTSIRMGSADGLT